MTEDSPERLRAVRRRPAAHAVAVVVVAVFVSACAARGPVAAAPQAAGVPTGRDTSSGPPQMAGLTLESTDERLTAALLQLATAPGAGSHRRVAQEYRRLGVLDKAHEYFSATVLLDPLDAASHEALARIWRDWGTPHLGLGDAYRAVYHAPGRASAANTLGTLLHAIGDTGEARRWYERALAIDPAAWYALNNLCYLGVMSRQEDARDTCQRAVAAAPDSKVAQNNLALAHAAAGDVPRMQLWFRRAGDAAAAHYNHGIVLMATREYGDAVLAFQAALVADPLFTQAAVRARQARLAAAAEDERRDAR